MPEFIIDEIDETERGILSLDYNFSEAEVTKATHYVQANFADFGVKFLGTQDECRKAVEGFGGTVVVEE